MWMKYLLSNFRWTEAIAHCKKGLQVCSSRDVAMCLSFYGRLIEAQVKDQCYEDAMGTFRKLKKFNLNSINASDVDVKTPMSDALKFISIMKTYSSEYLMKNMDAGEFDKDKKVIKIITYLGNLCEWKSGIFQGFGNQEQQCNWLKVACSLYNFHWKENADVVMCNKYIYGDLIERIIHAACMIYGYERKQGTAHILRKNEDSS